MQPNLCPFHPILSSIQLLILAPTSLAMAYISDNAKWEAYQFLDPFAANSFYVCNKINKRFCRPNCEAYPVIELRSEVRFVDTPAEAIDLGFMPCESCDPTSPSGIDVAVIKQTVAEVNKSIGFTLPHFDDDEKEILPRRQSVPAINEGPGSKNNSEHFRLVDLACRHLALAAAVSLMAPALPLCSNSPSSADEGFASCGGKKKRKRRGGVMGFKELAAKSKLSAWHFHRVFKSVTGLTPKTYGDKCWDFLQDSRKGVKIPAAPQTQSRVPRSMGGSDCIPEYSTWSAPRTSESELDISLGSGHASLVSSIHLPHLPCKRSRSDEDDMPLPKRMAPPAHFNYETPITATPLVDPTYSLDESDTLQFDFGQARALSDLDLSAMAQRPYSLFSQQPKQQPEQAPALDFITPNFHDGALMANPMMQPVPDVAQNALMGTMMPQEAQDVAFNDFSDLFAPTSGLDVGAGLGQGLGAGLGDDLVDLQRDMTSDLFTSVVGI